MAYTIHRGPNIINYRERCTKCNYIESRWLCCISTGVCTSVSESDWYIDKRTEKEKNCKHNFIKEEY